MPDYQREYVWTEKEVQQLLQDIDEEFGGGDKREYFIGTVSVSPTQQKNHFEVIDGQQRLTTLFLLLCVLRQRFKGDPQYSLFTGLLSTSYADVAGNLKTSLKLEPRYEHAGELMNCIVAVDDDPQATKTAIAAAGIPTYGSLENLLTAFSTIHRFLEANYKDIDMLRKYWGYVANERVRLSRSVGSDGPDAL